MQHEEKREGREGNSLLGRPVLCQVVVENKADWTFAPLSVRISDFVVAGTANRICGSMAEWGGL